MLFLYRRMNLLDTKLHPPPFPDLVCDVLEEEITSLRIQDYATSFKALGIDVQLILWQIHVD